MGSTGSSLDNPNELSRHATKGHDEPDNDASFDKFPKSIEGVSFIARSWEKLAWNWLFPNRRYEI
jgi:hypothetical protein